MKILEKFKSNASLISIIVTIRVLCLADATTTCDENRWLQFKTRYSKRYANEQEDKLRSRIFCKNVAFIKEYNNNKRLASQSKLHVNGLTDLDASEIDRLFMKNGHDLMAEWRREIASIKDDGDKEIFDLRQGDPTIPDSIDWSSDPTIVGPIQNQGDCGACWAFTILALIEANQYKRWPEENVTLLSAQQLVDCDYVNHECQGGSPIKAFQYIKKVGGVESAKSYPFTSQKSGKAHLCRFDKGAIHKSSTNLGYLDWDMSKSGDESYLKTMIAFHKPVAVQIYTNLSFIYALGDDIIFEEDCLKNFTANHGVLVVGYGTNAKGEEYWKIKNSFGEGWGSKGYGYMPRNRNNHCGIASWPMRLADNKASQ